jgi:hypothetical protein
MFYMKKNAFVLKNSPKDAFSGVFWAICRNIQECYFTITSVGLSKVMII